jgi:hypothetical protein
VIPLREKGSSFLTIILPRLNLAVLCVLGIPVDLMQRERERGSEPVEMTLPVIARTGSNVLAFRKWETLRYAKTLLPTDIYSMI